VVRLGWAVTLVLAGGPLLAQSTSPDEQARGLLEDGRAYRREGKLKQALDNFNTIVTGFPNTDSVDDALLEIGRYEMEVEGNADKAREAFELVTKRYPQSDGAPGAYYYLGLLTLERATTSAELDDALAQFARVQRLYPRSDWVAKALYGAALAHRKAGRLPEAVESARRVALEYFLLDFRPGTVFGLMGALLALFGAIFGGYHWYRGEVTGVSTLPGTVMVAAVPFIVGVQLLLQAVLLDMAEVRNFAPLPPLEPAASAGASALSRREP